MMASSSDKLPPKIPGRPTKHQVPPKPEPPPCPSSQTSTEVKNEKKIQTRTTEQRSEATFKSTEAQVMFMRKFQWDTITSLKKSLEEVDDIRYEPASRSFTIVGTTNGIEKAAKSLKLLSQKLLSKCFQLEGPGMRKQLEMDTTERIIDNIGAKENCIFEQNDDKKNQKIVAGAKNPSSLEGSGFSFPNDNEIRTKIGQRVSIVDGDLSKQMVDAIVNTTNKNVDLKANLVGKALLKVGGKDFEKECKQIKSLKLGEAARTKGGKLHCEHVYHVIPGVWDKDTGKEVLRKILKKCLLETVKDNHSSLAIPAIGTGMMAYPVEVVAKVFFQEVLYFFKTNTESTLKDVRFVLPKREMADVFRAEINSMKVYSSIAASNNNNTHLFPPNSGVSKLKNDTSSHSLAKNFPIKILLGDITKESTDVIMHVTNSKLSLQGGVARALVNAGGDAIVKECQAISSNIVHIVNYTSAGKLTARQIAHVTAPDQPSADDLMMSLDTFFHDITIKGFKTVSFSAIGSGSIGLSDEESAKLILRSLAKHLKRGVSPLTLVRIVIFDKEKFKTFVAAVKAYLVFTPKEAHCSKTMDSDPSRASVCFQVHGLTIGSIDRAWAKLQQKMREPIETKSIADPSIAKITEEEADEIGRLGEVHDADVIIKRVSSRVEITGLANEVVKVQGKIQEILKRDVPRDWKPQPSVAFWSRSLLYP